jgi:hypothetical protein
MRRHDDPRRDDFPLWALVLGFVMLVVGLVGGALK